MEVRKSLIIDTQEDTAQALSAQFNDKSVDSFVTKPLAGFSNLPCMGDFRCYGRISGKREKDGWTLTEEFFYGQGAEVPESPRVQQTSAVAGVSNADAVKRVLGFKPPVFDEGW